jgi:hypothetical protein
VDNIITITPSKYQNKDFNLLFNTNFGKLILYVPSPDLYFIAFVFDSILSKHTETVSTSAKKKKVNVALKPKIPELGDSFNRDNKVDSAFYYYNKSKELFEVGGSSYIAYNLLEWHIFSRPMAIIIVVKKP